MQKLNISLVISKINTRQDTEYVIYALLAPYLIMYHYSNHHKVEVLKRVFGVLYGIGLCKPIIRRQTKKHLFWL